MGSHSANVSDVSQIVSDGCRRNSNSSHITVLPLLRLAGVALKGGLESRKRVRMLTKMALLLVALLLPTALEANSML